MPLHAEAVKHLMMKQGVTQQELGRRIGLSPSVINRLLRGPMFPMASHWPAVLDALGLEVVIRVKKEEMRFSSPAQTVPEGL